MKYLLGLIGHPVEHSLSPYLHKAALTHLGLEGDYRLIDIMPQEIEPGIAQILADGLSGFNITIPHKETIFKFCAELSPEANHIKAVNTVKIDSSKRLIGHNTDVGGFLAALAEALPNNARTKSAVVIGAGGAARAAIWGLAQQRWKKIQVVARNPVKGKQMLLEIQSAIMESKMPCPDFSLEDLDYNGLNTAVSDLVVNCTSIGLTESKLPEWFEHRLKWMNPEGTLFDLVYSPTNTATTLVRTARKLRINCVDGAVMLVRQAALAFEFWTGKTPSIEVMNRALDNARSLAIS